MIAAIGVAAVAITLAVTWALWPREEPPESSGQTLSARRVADVTEFPVCAPEWAAGTAGTLSFAGQLVVWDEEAKDRSGLFAADVRVHERFAVRKAAKGVFERAPVVAPGVLAWTEHLVGEAEELVRLWVAEPMDGPSRQIGSAMDVRALDAASERVVWLQRVESKEAPDGFDDQVWVYGLGTGKAQRIPAAAGIKTGVAVSEGLVAWSVGEPDAQSEAGVWVHDTTTGETLPPIGSAAISVDISGGRLVWCTDGGDVYGYDLRIRDRFKVTSAPGRQSDARIDDDLIVWRDTRASDSGETGDDRGKVRGDIYALDLSTGDELPICTHRAAQESPQVSGDMVMWLDERSGGWAIRGAVVGR